MYLLSLLAGFLGRRRFNFTDFLTYLYLGAGVIVMFGPVLWLILSSFKDEALLFEPNPTVLPERHVKMAVEGYENPLPLYDVTFKDTLVGEAVITTPNVQATNGVVHVIDRVLIPPQVADQLGDGLPGEEGIPYIGSTVIEGEVHVLDAVSTQTGIFPQLLIREGMTEMLVDEEQRFTLLAPSDEALTAFFEQYGTGILDRPELLADLLRYHILPDRYLLVNLYRNMEAPIPTLLEGAALPIRLRTGETRRLAQVGSPRGAEYTLTDPENPGAGTISVFLFSTPAGPSTELKMVREIYFNYENYTGALSRFNFWVYLRNSIVVTVVATLITLLINSMAAFALSKYQFRGRDAVALIILSTLMVPVSVILIPAFLVISKMNMINSLWGLIIPGAATPTGVFLLRQYMLTIPDELLDAARIDGASEWRIYWQVILPLARPALAVLAIFSVMWRWNDFLWPLIVVSRNELFTLPVALNAFQGGLDVQTHYILAMTVMSLLPITVVFAFLQRYITTGIATSGMK